MTTPWAPTISDIKEDDHILFDFQEYIVCTAPRLLDIANVYCLKVVPALGKEGNPETLYFACDVPCLLLAGGVIGVDRPTWKTW